MEKILVKPQSFLLLVLMLGILLAACQGRKPVDVSYNKAGKTADDCPINNKVISGGKNYISNFYFENFESGINFNACPWYLDSLSGDDPFSESGIFFTRQNIQTVKGYRNSLSFGYLGWLTAEFYSRSPDRKAGELLQLVNDPSGKANKVLKLTTVQHTDGALIRSSFPLPPRYRLSLKVGFPRYGDGISLLNGYDSGSEKAGPWSKGSAVSENGFYWLAILDTKPQPHNNIWIHHHRKFVIDSDNHDQGWMEIFNGKGFEKSGNNPIMVFAVDGKGTSRLLTGKPFISYANDKWQASGAVRAIDAYLPDQWYQVTFTRDESSYHFSLEGTFKFGGNKRYEAELDTNKRCSWHYNQEGESQAQACIDTGFFDEFGESFPFWPAGKAYPDYFMFGEPHINYYEGHVYYDDISLEVL